MYQYSNEESYLVVVVVFYSQQSGTTMKFNHRTVSIGKPIKKASNMPEIRGHCHKCDVHRSDYIKVH